MGSQALLFKTEISAKDLEASVQCVPHDYERFSSGRELHQQFVEFSWRFQPSALKLSSLLHMGRQSGPVLLFAFTERMGNHRGKWELMFPQSVYPSSHLVLIRPLKS